MILDLAVYVDGRRQAGELPLEVASEAGQQPGAFTWLGLYEPSEDEFDAVRREFDLHELAVEDAIHAHQRPKLEVYADTLLVVLKTVRYLEGPQDLEIGEILLFVGRDFVISVRHGEASPLSEVREQLDHRPDLCKYGTGAVMHAIIDHVVDDYEPVASAIESDLQGVERRVFSADPGRDPSERIYRLEREVLGFHRAVVPLNTPVDRLARGHLDLVHQEMRTYFRDVHDHLMRLTGQIDGFRDLLTAMLQANLAQITVRQNEDVRRISAWVAIVALPTMIFAIYGMNFEYMPELGWRFGFPLVLAITLALCGALYWRLRRAGWL